MWSRVVWSTWRRGTRRIWQQSTQIRSLHTLLPHIWKPEPERMGARLQPKKEKPISICMSRPPKNNAKTSSMNGVTNWSSGGQHLSSPGQMRKGKLSTCQLLFHGKTLFAQRPQLAEQREFVQPRNITERYMDPKALNKSCDLSLDWGAKYEWDYGNNDYSLCTTKK